MTPEQEDALVEQVLAEWRVGAKPPYLPPFQDGIRLAIRAAYAQGREDGYLIGFNVSGEGWNGEYPFGDNNMNPADDKDWIEHRDAAIRREP